MRTWLAALCLMCGCVVAAPEDELRSGLPDPQSVMIAVETPDEGEGEGEGDEQAPPPGRPAPTYVATRRTATHLNGMVGSVVELIHRISSRPPTEQLPDGARWGPFTPSLSRATLQLTIHRLEGGGFNYLLGVRPKGSSAEFVPFVRGTSDPATRSGQFEVFGGAMARIDPFPPLYPPHLLARYGTGEDHHAFVGLRIERLDGAVAQYRYDRLESGAGRLRFMTEEGVTDDPEHPMSGEIRSQWAPNGAGRADTHPPGVEAEITECWGPLFVLVYRSGPEGTIGDPARCAFTEPLPQTP